MSFIRLHKITNSDYINYLLIFCFFLYSLYIVKHHYDGHHLGLLYSNAQDLINGKIPYKEIFIQYGFLTTLIHSLILLLFENKLFFISVSGALFYSISILLISSSLKIIINSNYALLSSIIILFNHPVPLLPWPNYISFFFITLSIFIMTKKNTNYFTSGLFLSLAILSRQEILIPILLSFFILCLFNLKNFHKKYISNFWKLFLGFIIPIFFFIIYLSYSKIFFYWKSYFLIPGFYLELYEKNIYNLILDYIIFFSTKSFFNFILEPQFLIISIILFFNSILILMKILNKKKIENNILYISVLSILLSFVSLQIEIFRSYTSVIIGLIPLLFFLSKIRDQNLKNNLNKILIFPSIFAFIFYPFGNNSTFNLDYLKKHDAKLMNKKYSFYSWSEDKINSINLITKITNNCNVKYLDNLTFDSLYSTIGSFDRINILPFQSSSVKHYNLIDFTNSLKSPDINFIEKINLEIQKENIILLTNKNNHIYKNFKVQYTSDYSVIKINESNFVGKPNYLNIIVPKKCLR